MIKKKSVNKKTVPMRRAKTKISRVKKKGKQTYPKNIPTLKLKTEHDIAL